MKATSGEAGEQDKQVGQGGFHSHRRKERALEEQKVIY